MTASRVFKESEIALALLEQYGYLSVSGDAESVPKGFIVTAHSPELEKLVDPFTMVVEPCRLMLEAFLVEWKSYTECEKQKFSFPLTPEDPLEMATWFPDGSATQTIIQLAYTTFIQYDSGFHQLDQREIRRLHQELDKLFRDLQNKDMQFVITVTPERLRQRLIMLCRYLSTLPLVEMEPYEPFEGERDADKISNSVEATIGNMCLIKFLEPYLDRSGWTATGTPKEVVS
jgi:hypothetical protein